MDYNRITAIVEKYWEGETTLEEEALLREFFSTPHPDLPEALLEAAPMFRYFQQEAVKVLEEPPAKVVPLSASPFRHWMKYAAVLLVAVGIGYALKQQGHRQEQVTIAMKQEELNDPQRALDETKKALQLLAKNLNKGTAKMQKLSYFNDAATLIEGKE